MSEEFSLSKGDLKEGKSYKSKGGVVCKIMKVDADARVWAQTTQQKVVVEIPEDARFKEAEVSDVTFPARDAAELDKEIEQVKEQIKEKEKKKEKKEVEEASDKVEEKKEKKEKVEKVEKEKKEDPAKLYPVIAKHIETKYECKCKDNSIKFKIGEIICKFNAVDCMVIASEKIKDKEPNKTFKSGKWKVRYYIVDLYDVIDFKA